MVYSTAWTWTIVWRPGPLRNRRSVVTESGVVRLAKEDPAASSVGSGWSPGGLG